MNAPIPDLNKCVYVRTNYSSSFMYRRSEFFYESLQIAFPNNVLVISFTAKVNSTARHPTEEKGEVSRVH